MKTSVELDAEKVALAKRLSQTTTLRDLLDKSLDAFIAQSRRQTMADLLGTRFFAGNLGRMRQRRGRSRR